MLRLFFWLVRYFLCLCLRLFDNFLFLFRLRLSLSRCFNLWRGVRVFALCNRNLTISKRNRLWFCGRKSHRLETRSGLRMPVPTENVFNTHPRVNRTALVGVGERGGETPVLVVEPLPGEMPRGEVMTEGFIMQLKSIGRKSAITKDIEVFLFRSEFPVDVRHNAKIHREELKAWAEELLT